MVNLREIGIFWDFASYVIDACNNSYTYLWFLQDNSKNIASSAKGALSTRGRKPWLACEGEAK